MLTSKPKNIIPDFKDIVLINNTQYSLKITNNLLNFYYQETPEQEIQEFIDLKDIINYYLIINKKIDEKLLDPKKSLILSNTIFDFDKLSDTTPFMKNYEILYELGKILKDISYEYLKTLNLTDENIIFVIEFVKKLINYIIVIFEKSLIPKEQNLNYLKLSSNLVYKFTILTNVIIDINNKLYNNVQNILDNVSKVHKVVTDKISTLSNI
jgi:hypothetical protein